VVVENIYKSLLEIVSAVEVDCGE